MNQFLHKHQITDPLMDGVDPCVKCGWDPCLVVNGGECSAVVVGPARVQQVDASRPGLRGFLKKSVSRLLRRSPKINPGNAPVRPPFSGYSL